MDNYIKDVEKLKYNDLRHTLKPLFDEARKKARAMNKGVKSWEYTAVQADTGFGGGHPTKKKLLNDYLRANIFLNGTTPFEDGQKNFLNIEKYGSANQYQLYGLLRDSGFFTSYFRDSGKMVDNLNEVISSDNKQDFLTRIIATKNGSFTVEDFLEYFEELVDTYD